MATTVTGRTSARSGRIPVSRILRAGLVAAVLAVIFNGVISQIARAVLDAPDAFAPLQLPAVIFSTVGFILIGTLVFVGISRFARQPVRAFQIVAVIALLLSFSNPFFLLNSTSERFVGLTGPIIAALLLMHTAAAAITIPILTALGGRIEPGRCEAPCPPVGRSPPSSRCHGSISLPTAVAGRAGSNCDGTRSSETARCGLKRQGWCGGDGGKHRLTSLA